MKHIKKNVEPESFSAWKAAACEDWAPTYGNLSGQVKRDIYDSLLAEQGHICCYCERELIDADYHLEHLNPQCAKNDDELVYENFLCSCLNATAKGDPLHCGKLKDSSCIEIHPLQLDCVQQFYFTAAGEIFGLTDAANRTITILGLDIKKLTELRKEAIEPFLDDGLEDDEFQRFVNGYLAISQTGRLSPFYSLISSVFVNPGSKT